MKTKYYIDMDGVLAKWNTEASAEDTFEKGYFLNREPDEKAIRYVQDLLDDGLDVCILSHAYQNGYAEPEKQAWLQKYGLGNVPAIFVPYGTPKLEYVQLPVDTINFLVDDFTKNLREWETGENCRGIKYYNGINGTHGTWYGKSVNPELDPFGLALDSFFAAMVTEGYYNGVTDSKKSGGICFYSDWGESLRFKDRKTLMEWLESTQQDRGPGEIDRDDDLEL